MKTVCPDEETIASYVEGLLSEPEISRMETHLSECEACLSEFKLTSCMVRGGAPPAIEKAPPEVTRSALDLINRRDPALGSLVMEKVKRSLSAFHARLAQRFPMPGTWQDDAILVRGRVEAISDDLIRIRKDYREFEALIDIEKTRKDTALIRLRLLTRNGFGDRIRVTLKRDDREVCSSLYAGGDLVFEDISFGPCKLVFERDGREIGVYLFHIKETGNGKK